MSIDGPKKSSRGRPRVDSEPVKLRIEREVLNALDAYVARNHYVHSRQSGILLLLEDQLMGMGLLEDDTRRIARRMSRDRHPNMTDKEYRALIRERDGQIAAKGDPDGKPPPKPPRPPSKAK